MGNLLFLFLLDVGAYSSKTRRPALNWKRVSLDEMLGRNSFLSGWLDTGTGFPENLWLYHPWKCSVPGGMELWAIWSRGRCACPWQGIGMSWSLRSLSMQTILWFYEYNINILLFQTENPNFSQKYLLYCVRTLLKFYSSFFLFHMRTFPLKFLILISLRTIDFKQGR